MIGKDAPRSRAGRIGIVALAVAVVVPAAAFGVPGDFTQPSTSPEAAGSGALSVAAANLGGSTATDLAVSNPGDDNVSILIGNGSGDFTPASSSPEGVGSFPTTVAAANLNGDAHTDLAVGNFGASTVSILLGDGTGNFTAAGPPAAVGAQPLSLIIANLDSDADLDIATANAGANVSVLLGDGSGGFAAAGTSPEPTGGSNARALAAGSFNGDANADLAVANRDSGNVSILLGSASGDFAPAAGSPISTGSLSGATAVATGSFGGSAATDLAVANRNNDNVSILIGNGSGGFANAASSPEPAGDEPDWIAAANLGGDSSTDLAVANLNSNNVTILLGAGGGNFNPASTSPEAVGGGPRTIAAAQLGGDAGLDLATANTNTDNVSVLLNSGTTPATPAKKCKKKGKKKKGKKKSAAAAKKKKKKCKKKKKKKKKK